MAGLSFRALLAYGCFGLPLAMVALPIYVYVPQFYAANSGLGLAAIGAVLLAARLLAACIDPALGWWMARGQRPDSLYVMVSMPLLLLGFGALFHPPPLAWLASMAWFLLSLLLVYGGFGLATIAHQSWGAALSGDIAQRSRVTAVREGCGLLGVLLAAALTGSLGYDVLSLVFGSALLCSGALLLSRAPRPLATVAARPLLRLDDVLAPFHNRRFRALFGVLLVNGVAAAIPATLFLFFVEDRLRLGHDAGLFLILYFSAAAMSMPLWVVMARRFGEARAWLAAMLLSALIFVWAYALGAGAALGFGAICLLSGLTLGADLALPPALLAGLIAADGDGGPRAAAYFGWWNWGVQMSLALAAGIALPLLAWLGYVPGRDSGQVALSAAYALLPCALKLLAAWILWRAPLRDC
ncbi:MFS transporter [Janthinobacterium agaricidamnosum]|uniref:Putative membrane protein n=1 Tax=Janthinobacterium agaricidamnosum NBRC 102515 = DSM 9628 TaxID=1349767 RepID=W0VB46_9BURK|nr:MFS transporter [Janthinobacterium agaricidamnosum]CDG85101.1 putative membrane protein [Janthinobacterium agaricidamnosum NBRC 102515 = DSM 9628]